MLLIINFTSWIVNYLTLRLLGSKNIKILLILGNNAFIVPCITYKFCNPNRMNVFLLWMFANNWCWVKVKLSYIGRIKVKKYIFMFSSLYVKVILPCLHVPCITGLNLFCICTAISVINSGFHVSSVILSSWTPNVFLLWLFVSNWWCWIKVTEFYK